MEPTTPTLTLIPVTISGDMGLSALALATDFIIPCLVVLVAVVAFEWVASILKRSNES